MSEPGIFFENFLSAEIQSEYIRNLGGEDSNGDTACKAYDNRIGDKLNDCPQFEYSQKNEDDTRHQCGDNQPGLSVLLDNAVDNDDERTGRAADLNFAAAQQGDYKTGNNSRNNAFFR